MALPICGSIAAMEHLCAALADATVLDEAGAPVVLGTIIRDKPVVLVFLRHFG